MSDVNNPDIREHNPDIREHNPDLREQELRFYLRRLKVQAGLCSDKINNILRNHEQFASLMAQRIGDASLIAHRIDDASKSQYDLEDDGLETMRLAKEIRYASRLLATNVERIKYELKAFVSILRKEKVQQEQSLVERILQWLRSLIDAIRTIFAAINPSTCDPDRYHSDPEIRESRLAETALGQAASKFCKVGSGAFLKNIILPLQGQK